MTGLDVRIKPLYSRILALNIDKYLQSRSFELASIELNLDDVWNRNYREISGRYIVPNVSIICEKAFGGLLDEISIGLFNANGAARKALFLEQVWFLLVDYSKWAGVRNDYGHILEALLDLGYEKGALNILEGELEAAQKDKPEKKPNSETISNFEREFWLLINKKIVKVSKERFDDGYYTDAIFRGITEINYQVKKIVKKKTGEETDGVNLMRKAFCVNNNLILLMPELGSQTEKDIQEGFMNLFTGSMQCLRNPNAHDNNIEIDKDTAVHYLFLLSILMNRLDAAKY